MKQARMVLPIPNFSVDTRPLARGLAGVAFLFGAIALATTTWMLIESRQMIHHIVELENLGTKLAAKSRVLRDHASQLPASQEFERLRGRIANLNQLDANTGVSVGGLLDSMESILPDRVVVTSLSYDRAVSSVDLSAVSLSSEDLTSFFDALHRTKLFSQVRLVEKIQVDLNGSIQTQVRIYLQVSGRDGVTERETRS